MTIIKKERTSQADLIRESARIGLDIDAIEHHNEFKLKEREREITKLYQRMSNKFRQIISQGDGALKVRQRKIKKFLDPKKKEKMLFDGIRDQKLNVKWVGTPQAIVTKVLVTRQLRDKVPKGEYVIRASVLDRLIQNKMEYKFIEYGNRLKDIKAKEKIEAEKDKQAKEDAEKQARLDAILNTERSEKMEENFKISDDEESDNE